MCFREVAEADAPPAPSWASGSFCLTFLVFFLRVVVLLAFPEVAAADVSKLRPDFAPTADVVDAGSKSEPDFAPAVEAVDADPNLGPDFALLDRELEEEVLERFLLGGAPPRRDDPLERFLDFGGGWSAPGSSSSSSLARTSMKG